MAVAGLFGASQPFDASCALVSSPFLSPAWLAGVRLVLAFYMTFTLLFVLIWEITRTHNANQFFSFFTELTGIGLAAYLWQSGSQTAIYALRSRRAAATGVVSKPLYPLQSWPKTLQVLHMILLASIRTFPILVTIVFWTLLASAHSLRNTFLRYNNVSLHTINTLCALFEIFGTNTPLATWFTLVPLSIILCGYLGVAYITHATQGFYPYAFLDPEKGSAKLAGYIIGIAVAEIIIFSLVQGLVWLRTRLLRKRTTDGKVANMVQLKESDHELGQRAA
ncbi:hypothetical protein EXIGLDRAFT_830649 [Exidia glandulosa HHB12029]|uniref:FAR-17a/AIG1-like protein n=1 Tax=Exidia glandulosa HHB12029 TaxID=1314781 RepID=A0A165NB60_EXIGL|nr:hypothetical protein EXIGLDRAFT_830649 [Exidia glandulosa HHB12029]